jgi:hypothetical protein
MAKSQAPGRRRNRIGCGGGPMLGIVRRWLGSNASWAIDWPVKGTIPRRCRPTLGTATSSTRSGIPNCRRCGSRTSGASDKFSCQFSRDCHQAVMIGMEGAGYSVGMREWMTERGLGLRSVPPCRGEFLSPAWRSPQCLNFRHMIPSLSPG